MTQYKFAEIELPNIYGVSAPVPIRVAKGKPVMRHGGHVGRRFLDERTINVQGVFLPVPGQSFMDMEIAYSQFISSLALAGTSRLFLRHNWFYDATLNAANEGKREIGSIEYDLEFYNHTGRQFKLGPNADGSSDAESTINITFNTVFNTMAGIWTPAKLVLNTVVGHSTDVELSPKYGAGLLQRESLFWKPGSTGNTTVYLDEQRAERNGFDVTSEFDGNFFSIDPATTMKIDSVATGITPTIIYREALL